MIKLILKQLEVFDSPIWLLIPTYYIVRNLFANIFTQTDSNSMIGIYVSMNE